MHAEKQKKNFATTSAMDIVVVAEIPADGTRPKRTPRVKQEVQDDVQDAQVPVAKKHKRAKRKKVNKVATAPPKKKAKKSTVQPLGVSLRSVDTKTRSSKTSRKAREAAKLLEKSIETTGGLLSVKTFAIKKARNKRRKLKCQYCGEVHFSQRSVNQHMSKCAS